MSTIYDFSRKINELNTKKQYKEALLFFKLNKTPFDQQEIGTNMYLVSNMLNCLRHEKELEAAFKFLERYDVKVDDSTPERVLTATAWVLYDKFKAENDTSEVNSTDHWHEKEEIANQPQAMDVNKNELIVQIELMIAILQKKDSEYCQNAMEFLFKIVIKAEIKRQKTNWYFVLSFCENIDPQKLSTQCKTITVTQKGQAKDMELASVREEWYAHSSKALFMTGRFQQCLEFSEMALDKVDKFHYSNDLWLARRMALCMKKMGNLQQAIANLEKLLRKRRDWFIVKELSQFYLETGNDEKALGYAKEAMNAYGPITFKVELIEMLGDMLTKKGETEMGYKHYAFAKMLREQEKWNVDRLLQNKLETYERANSKEAIDRKKIELDLKTCWKPAVSSQETEVNHNKKSADNNSLHTGVINRLLQPKEAGIDGFVKNDDGGSAYFFIPKDNKMFNLLRLGLRLEYQTVAAQNGKGDKAIKMKII